MISDEQLTQWEDQFRGSPSVFDRGAGLAVCAEVRRLRAENEKLRPRKAVISDVRRTVYPADESSAMVDRVAERIERELGPDNELAVEPITLSPEQEAGFASIGRAASRAAHEIAQGLGVTASMFGDAVGQVYARAMAVQPPSYLSDAVCRGTFHCVSLECVEPAADTPVVVEGPK